MPNSTSSWDQYFEGLQVGWKFSFSQADMQSFIELSTDDSPIHTDPEFAKARNYKSPLLHGALLSTQLSRLIGKELPDSNAMTVGFSIDFLNPSYVDEELEFNAKLTHKSESTRLIELAFKITGQNKVVGKGKISARWQG